MDTLVRNLRQAKYVRRAVLLALDRAYDGNGVPASEGATFAVDNEDVLAWCRSAPNVLLFGASVHPRRHDALEELERCAAQGAALVKWLPNAQNIDPAARGYIPYYRKLVELGLPLLCHSGYEFALSARDQSLGRLERLQLPLDEGVTVIAAHSGSTGIFVNRSAMNNFAYMLHRHPNLYGETAALALPNRMGALLWWRRHPELFHRLFFATDFPVPQWAWVWGPFLSAPDYRRLIRETNPFDRMATLLQSLGVYPRKDGFEDLLGRLGRAPGRVLQTESGASNHSLRENRQQH